MPASGKIGAEKTLKSPGTKPGLLLLKQFVVESYL